MQPYMNLNYTVMVDTKKQYESIPKLKAAVQYSIKNQYMVKHEDLVSHPQSNKSTTQFIVSPKRSLEAASGYQGKKVAVLNFANNHDVGGAPFSSGAQEESICRCSTLYPCLQAMWDVFYSRHRSLYEKHIINHIGNDDLIYTPDVIVFKTDERSDPVYPMMMPEDKWFKVDIITCAAPELRNCREKPDNYEDVIASRIRRILDVAASEHVEVLILGAWGCGAFQNPADIVAKSFHDLLTEYDFETVEFALASEGALYKIFSDEMKTSALTPTGKAVRQANDKIEYANDKPKFTRRPLLIFEKAEEKISYNPMNRHWYLDTHSTPNKLQQYPTRTGFVDSGALTQTKTVTNYCGINIDHFTSYDIYFMKDDQNHIGVFTMVSTSSEMGSFYRSDRKGFGYKSAILYFDTLSSPNMGAHHYLVTQDLEGKWSMVDLYHPISPREYGYSEFICRDKIAKGFDSEKRVVDYFKNTLNGPDLCNTERFQRIDSEVPIEVL